jgi:hypothetical protein
MLTGFGVFLCHATAQVQLGSNLQMSASGSLTAGYSGGYGSESSSSHSLDLGGSGSINGSYYNPNFASFHILPYYDQSRTNSNYQSIGGSSGISSDVNLFTGSHFPGTIGYQKTYNSTGTYGVAGSPNFTTHGNGQGYDVAWSVLLPNLPTLSVSYMAGSGDSNIYGSSSQSSSNTKNFNLRSSYAILGFRTDAFYTHGATHGDYPQVLTGITTDEISDSFSHSEGFDVSHILPIHGSFNATFSHSNYGSKFMSTDNSNNSTNTATAAASFRPESKLTFSVNTTYTTNLAGYVNEQIVSSGGTAVETNLGSNSNSTSINSSVGYSLGRDMFLSGNVSHTSQSYSGFHVGATYMSGTFNYNRRLFGMFTFSGGVLDSATDEGNSAVGMTGNVSFAKRIKNWDLGATVSYSQNVQTLLVSYTTSNVNYSTTASRRLTRRLYWNSTFGGSNTLFSQQVGDSSGSQSVSSGLSVRKYSLNGGYSKSHGVSILTANGLVSTGIPVVVSATNQVLYNASSYTLGATASPIRKLVVSAGYSHAVSNTTSYSVSSLNQTDMFNSQLQYQFRRMAVTAGYTRFSQGIGASGTAPAKVSSFYLGVSRWFSLF